MANLNIFVYFLSLLACKAMYASSRISYPSLTASPFLKSRVRHAPNLMVPKPRIKFLPKMIEGGEPATPKPWMALLRTGFDDVTGGGVLISENMILTAAHLPNTRSLALLRAATMRFKVQSNAYAEKGIDFNVLQVFNHPEYNISGNYVSLTFYISKMILQFGLSIPVTTMVTHRLISLRCPGTWMNPH